MRDVAYIALGSNLGDRELHLARARDAITRLPDSRVVGESSIDETEPLGYRDQPMYLNQMVALETSLTPRQLLDRLHAIETDEGRTRRVRWDSRTLDLDIVCFERQMVREPGLDVPHPGLADRVFWQRELAQLRDRELERR
jgi:2-amino-4-hydroxy-6-hydroxymethyldihydropteridine diphosphokinase